MGDRSNFTVVYDVEFDDPSALEGIEPGEDGTLPLVAEATRYVDTTVDLPAGQETTWQGADVTIDAVAVSSVGVTVDYTIERQIGDLGHSGRLSNEAQAEQDAVLGLPVTVTFAGGTTFDATNANTHAEEQNDGTSAVTKTVTYDRIIAAGDIVSVIVASVLACGSIMV